jgi:Putative lumazine-binding
MIGGRYLSVNRDDRRSVAHPDANAARLGDSDGTPTSQPEEAAMAIQQQQRSHDGIAVEDFDAIAATVQLYIDGVARGDVAKLTEAFHPDARMYGAIGDHSFDMPISALFESVAATPADVDGTYRARITSIVQIGEAAAATVAEENYLGALSFAEFLHADPPRRPLAPREQDLRSRRRRAARAGGLASYRGGPDRAAQAASRSWSAT